MNNSTVLLLTDNASPTVT